MKRKSLVIKPVPAYIRKLILLDDKITLLLTKRGGEQDINATTNYYHISISTEVLDNLILLNLNDFVWKFPEKLICSKIYFKSLQIMFL